MQALIQEHLNGRPRLIVGYITQRISPRDTVPDAFDNQGRPPDEVALVRSQVPLEEEHDAQKTDSREGSQKQNIALNSFPADIL